MKREETIFILWRELKWKLKMAAMGIFLTGILLSPLLQLAPVLEDIWRATIGAML